MNENYKIREKIINLNKEEYVLMEIHELERLLKEKEVEYYFIRKKLTWYEWILSWFVYV